MPNDSQDEQWKPPTEPIDTWKPPSEPIDTKTSQISPIITKLTGITRNEKGQLEMRIIPWYERANQLGQSLLPESPQVTGKGIVGRALYENILRPIVSPLGLFQVGQGLTELPYNRNVPVSQPRLQPPAIPKPTALQIPNPQVGTPIFNTPQFGLHLGQQPSQYPLNITPNRLRPPSTNATVFDALLPERLKYNEQGAALPLTTSTESGLSRSVTFKPAIDIENAAPIQATAPEQLIIPKPGQARASKDINPIRAGLGSVDRTLESRPESAPIAKEIITAQDEKLRFIATTGRQLAETTKGLNRRERMEMWDVMNGDITSQNPSINERAQQAKVILDSVFDMIPGGSEGEVGYWEKYITHMKKMDTDTQSAMQFILDNHLGGGLFKSIRELFSSKTLGTTSGGTLGDFLEKGLGDPNSPFTKERIGTLNQLEKDVNKVFPAYIESIAKSIFDKPAVDRAKTLIKDLPDSNLKTLAEWYIKNYTRYDAMGNLNGAWEKFTRGILTTTNRTFLSFNPGLQALHLARIPANLFPELPSQYILYGAKKVGTSPIVSWHEMARLGMLPQEIRPLSFRTAGEKFDSVANFLSIADSLDRAIGYHGFKQMFLDKGLPEAEASLQAIAASKRASLTVDPARPMQAFSTRGMQGTALRTTLQYKHVPAKILEQYTSIASKAMSDPASAARLVAGVSFAYGLHEAGLHTFHFSPLNLVPTEFLGPFGETVRKVAGDLSHGNVEQAIIDTAIFATPAGKSIEKQIKFGPSLFENP